MKISQSKSTYHTFRSSIMFGLLRSCVSFALSLFCGYMLSDLINKALEQDRAGVLLYALATSAALAVGLPLLHVLSGKRGKARLYELQQFKESLYDKIIERRIDMENEGELDVKLSADCKEISKFMAESVPEAIGSMIVLAGATVLIAITDWRVCVVFTVMNLLQLVPTVVYEKWARQAYDDLMDDEDAYRGWLLEGSRGMRTLKAYGREGWFIEKFKSLNREAYCSGKRAEQVSTVEEIVFETVNAITTYGSYLVVGAFSILWGLPAAKIPILMILGENLFSSISDVYELRISQFSYEEASERIAEQTPPTVKVTSGGETLLSVSHVKKAFAEKTVLQDASLKIGANEHLLLRGGNGSGKSTLLRVALGLERPDGGEAFMREGLAVSDALQQETGLAVSGRELMDALGEAGEVDSGEMDTIAHGFGMSEELLSRPLAEYSGTELKKFYLSAAFAKPADLIVLDEPTNHIDADSADYLLSLIQDRDGAVVVCSHDERLMRLAWDRTITVSEGRLYE